MVDSKRGVAVFFRIFRSRIFAAIVLCIFCASTVYAAVSSSCTVEVQDGTQVASIVTTRQDPFEILAQADIQLGAYDKLELSGFVPGQDSIIVISRAFPVTVEANKNLILLSVNEGTVADALELANVTLLEADEVNYPLDTPLTADMRIVVERAFDITVTADGLNYRLRAVHGTVEDALRMTNVLLEEHDVVNPALDADLSANLAITVDRVVYLSKTRNEEIPYETVKENTDTLYVGQTKTVEAGVAGEKLIAYREKVVNGEVVETTIETETILTEAKPAKVLVGTAKKPAAQSVQTVAPASSNGMISALGMPSGLEIGSDGAPTSYRYFIDGLSAAYTAPKGAKTATGRSVMPGYIAVNPQQIPYGTEMWIVSHDGKYVYGYAIAADTGGFASQGRFTTDLFFNTETECVNFGARNVRIYIL